MLFSRIGTTSCVALHSSDGFFIKDSKEESSVNPIILNPIFFDGLNLSRTSFASLTADIYFGEP